MNNRRNVSIGAAEWRYLVSAPFLSDELRGILLQGTTISKGAATLDLDLQGAEYLRSAFTERLAAGGFDEEYDPNAEGETLERLIDAFAA